MRLFKRWISIPVIALAASANLPAAQSTSDRDAIAAVRSLALKIEHCSPAEEVAQLRKKWVKVAWGPPSNVKFDVQRTQSLVAPYEGTITFSIPYSGGEQHAIRREAEDDKNLRVIFVSPVRYMLRISEDSTVQIEKMEIKNTLAGGWSDYDPVRPGRFCWITAIK